MNLAQYIDHTVLKADAKKEDIVKACNEAIEYNFYSVCVNSCHVSLVKSLLQNTNVKTVSVVGFPLGAMNIESKGFEAKTAVENGADEIDVVINIGALKDKDYEYVLRDIKNVLTQINDKVILKVIIETSLLNNEEKIMACKLSKEAGAHFVKTSTGFSTGGATVEDVKLMKSIVGDKMGVKASGGIKNKDIALEMIKGGASRIGASSSVEIIKS